jgi:hypothetical protein
MDTGAIYRSEAFAEDLTADGRERGGTDPRRRSPARALLVHFVLPLALALSAGIGLALLAPALPGL